MTAKQIFQSFARTLHPIIMDDEDIQGCIKRNDFNDEECKNFVFWLINATICVILKDDKRDVVKELVSNCKHDLKVYENLLIEAGYGDEVRDTLWEILKENIDEWMQILIKTINESAEEEAKKSQPKKTIKKPIKKTTIKKTAKKSTIKGSNTKETPAMATFNLHSFFLQKIVLREDDVLEFLEKWSSKASKEHMTTYLIWNVLFTYLHEIKEGRINPPAEYPLVKYLDEVLQIVTKGLDSIYGNYISQVIDNTEAFDDDVKEIITDHLNEFVKKMIKQVFKAAEEVRKQ